MTINKLSVNPNKTEYILFNPNNTNLPLNIINLSSNTISSNDSTRNLNVVFHINISMDKLISSTVKSHSIKLCDLYHIHPFMSKTTTLANALVYSRLDFCNSLFYGFPKHSIHCLQKVQNTVAHIRY